MKIIAINILAIMAVVAVVSCDDDFDDPNLDFSNSFPQYVELSSSSDLEGAADSSVVVTVRIRENIFSAINVSYSVSGDFSTSGSVTILEGELSAPISVEIPATPATGSATLTLDGVDNDLSIGRPNVDSSPTSVNIVW